MCVCALSHFSHVRLFATLWTLAHQATLSMGFCRQQYWSGLPCPPPWDLADPGIEPSSLTPPALASRFYTSSTTWDIYVRERVCVCVCVCVYIYIYIFNGWDKSDNVNISYSLSQW